MLIGTDYQVYLIDLNRAKIARKLSRSARLDDLKKLYFGTGDREFSDSLESLFFEVYADPIEGPAWQPAYHKARAKLLAYRKLKRSVGG